MRGERLSVKCLQEHSVFLPCDPIFPFRLEPIIDFHEHTKVMDFQPRLVNLPVSDIKSCDILHALVNLSLLLLGWESDLSLPSFP